MKTIYEAAQVAKVYPINMKCIAPTTTDRVCLIDGDGAEGFDNTALQKISAWEKRNGVQHVHLIKLRETRVGGILRIHPDSLAELYRIRGYNRVYASFIFTRSKPLIAQLRSIVPHVFVGGTGEDEYHERQPGELREKPKKLTQLPTEIFNMYPDFNLYESPTAEAQVSFWKNLDKANLPRQAKKMLAKSPNSYGIPVVDSNDLGGADGSIPIRSETITRYDLLLAERGYADGTVWRGSQRGTGKSSLGCSRMCTFCCVPALEGAITPIYYGLLGTINWVLPKETYWTMTEIVELYRSGKLLMRPFVFFEMERGRPKSATKVKKISPFVSLSDNNFTADPSCLEKLDFLIKNKISVNLNQGIDSRLLSGKERQNKDRSIQPSGDEICDRLARLDFMNFHGTAKQIHVSWDYIGAKKAVMAGIEKLIHYGRLHKTRISYRSFTVYCLVGFNTTFEEDLERISFLRDLRIDPFCMLFRNTNSSEGTNSVGEPHDWRLKHLVRWTNKRELFRKVGFDDYEPYLAETRKRNDNIIELNLFNYLDPMNEEDQIFDWLVKEYIHVA